MAGTPEHRPTPEQRVTVKEAAGLGIPLKSMCYLVGLADDKTLTKHYAKEIGEGKAEAGQVVTRRLRDKIDEGDTASIMFYLKTQLGWREKDQDGSTADLIHVIKRIIVDGTGTQDPKSL